MFSIHPHRRDYIRIHLLLLSDMYATYYGDEQNTMTDLSRPSCMHVNFVYAWFHR